MYPKPTKKFSQMEQRTHKILTELGVDFDTQDCYLPGTPDISLKSQRLIIEVRGCFFHRHPDQTCPDMRTPGGQADWGRTFRNTVTRDQANAQRILGKRYRLLILWTCALRWCAQEKAKLAISDFISGSAQYAELGHTETLAHWHAHTSQGEVCNAC